MTRWMGLWMCAVAVLHTVVGVKIFRGTLSKLVADGGWNALGRDPTRHFAFWFLVGGVMMFLLGLLTDALEASHIPLPRAYGWGLLALALIGILLLPRSGFWLLLPPAIGALLRAGAM